MKPQLLISACLMLCLASNTKAELYRLAPIHTQCYLFCQEKLDKKIPCQFSGQASTGKIWWVRRDFILQNGKKIKTLVKDTQRKYLTKHEKILMPVQHEPNPAEDQISIALIDGKPAIQQNRLLKDYHVLSWEEFWGKQNELTLNQLTDRLACLQVEDKSIELCTPYHVNDFRTD